MALEGSGTILYVAKISYQSHNWYGNCQGGPKLYTDTHIHTHTHTHTQTPAAHFISLFSLVSFLKKKKTYKIGSWCVCVCVKFWSPPNNFQTSYPIDTKFQLHIVSCRNSRTPLIPFLNFEKCALEKFFKFIFSPFN